VAQARASGNPIPERSVPTGGFGEIYQPPSASDAVDINAVE
jgi:hypothetical protein